MNILLLSVGKRHDAHIADAINDYTARLQHYAKTEWHIVPSPKGALSPDEQRGLESRKLQQALKPNDTVIILDERGVQWTTPEFARQIASYHQTVSRIVFIIGGAYGVTDDLRQRAQVVWALSRLVFPHQLVRLILAEQLYRAFTVVAGSPYHHQ